MEKEKVIEAMDTYCADMDAAIDAIKKILDIAAENECVEVMTLIQEILGHTRSINGAVKTLFHAAVSN